MRKIKFTGIFCDDVRHEVNGKFTLVGCYGPAMFVSRIPITLPVFGVHFELEFSPDSPPSMVKILLRLEGEELGSSEMCVEDLEIRQFREPPTQATIGGKMLLQGFTIEKIGDMELWADVDGEAILGKRLVIIQSDPTDMIDGLVEPGS